MELDFLPDPSIYQVIPYSITPEKFKEMNIFGQPTRLEPYYQLENRYELFKPNFTKSVSDKVLCSSLNSLSPTRKSHVSLSSMSLIESTDNLTTSTESSLSSITNTSSVESVNKQYQCTLCRKSFATEATYSNHLKTQKHKSMLEKENKKNQNNKKSFRKKKSENLSISTTHNAAAIEAYKKLKQAEKIRKSHPSIAANVYWNAATVFWNCKLAQETANTLHQLLIILLQHKNRLPKKTSFSGAINSSAQDKKSNELTPAQISQTIYLACVALARLIGENYGSSYKTWSIDEDLDEDEENISLEATSLYLMALKEKYDLCIDSVQEFSDLLTTTTMAYSKFKENCNVILRKCNPVAILTKTSESAFYLLLNEVASFHSRMMPDHISLVLYGIASAHAYKEERWTDFVNVNKRICKIFNSLNFFWLSCNCLQDAARGTDIELLTVALMLSIRMDDRVQCNILEKQIKSLLKDENIPFDVQYILNLSKCIRYNDHLWLEESGYDFMDISNKENCLYDDLDETSYLTLHNIEQLYFNVKNRMDIIL